MMSDLMTRNLQLVRNAFNKKEIHYFSTAEYMISYTSCDVDLKHRTLKPTNLRVTVIPYDNGVLFEASLPIALHAQSEEELRLILRRITKENYSNIRGGLTYQAETGQLKYRIFYAFGEDEASFNDAEAVKCLRVSAVAVSHGYESIVNALDETIDDDDDNDHGMSIPQGVHKKLRSLLDQMLSKTTSAVPEQENADLDDEDGDSPDISDEDDDLDPDLSALLEDLLGEETDSD